MTFADARANELMDIMNCIEVTKTLLPQPVVTSDEQRYLTLKSLREVQRILPYPSRFDQWAEYVFR